MVLNRSIWYRMRLALVVGLILPLVACAQVRSLPTMPYAGKR